MNQPDLGKKIAELRKTQGLTQEELVEKCNLSVRTIQRIESGQVMPRSYTLKIILAALDHEYSSLTPVQENNFKSSHSAFGIMVHGFIKSLLDLFNLKTNTMKKISILSSVTVVIILLFTFITTDSLGQSAKHLRNTIETSNKDFIRWFNTGQIDSLVSIYSDDACLYSRGCGKAFIRAYYSAEMQSYKFKEITIYDISHTDSLAVEKGQWKINLNTGMIIVGDYLSEWKYIDNKWLVVSEMASIRTE
ncbi:MAG: helix-turn-helix domain-containing protein [Bacteroidales bacterium]|nr:helix-turn-helix domain-containing protein [Bacteroidales bacterium]MBN2817686.1 helix-turn-helix domain-containing protein [Bacteroidales bacterium]